MVRTTIETLLAAARRLRPLIEPAPRQVILFLAADQRGSSGLNLAKEYAEIERELKTTTNRTSYQLESRWAVSVDELMRHVTELDPTVIHLSCHGGHGGEVLLQDEHGEPQSVPVPALALMVAATGRRVRVVVLDSCYGALQAEALLSAVECVVCMNGAVEDDAARAFAVRFYGALGNGRSIGNSVAHGIAALVAKQLPDAALPRCFTRIGTHAHELFLTPDDGRFTSR